MKIFISQPMNGILDSTIKLERERIEAMFPGNEFINSYIPENKDVDPLVALSESIKLMAEADLVVVPTWNILNDFRGCIVESTVATQYGIPKVEIDMYSEGLFRMNGGVMEVSCSKY